MCRIHRSRELSRNAISYLFYDHFEWNAMEAGQIPGVMKAIHDQVLVRPFNLLLWNFLDIKVERIVDGADRFRDRVLLDQLSIKRGKRLQLLSSIWCKLELWQQGFEDRAHCARLE